MSRALNPDASAREIAAAIHSGETTARAVVAAALERIARLEPRLHAFISVQPGMALARARDLDRLKPAQKSNLPLLGVPVAVKDNYNLRGTATTCGSRVLAGYVSPYTATAVARLEAAGAVIVGKTNLDEFAMGSSTEHSAFGPTRNPWDESRVPGGSSGGSAAAVAAGLVPLALGSDTGGSVKQPAALCGIYGLRPTYGAISRYGVAAFASSLDTVAPFARDPDDLDLALSVMAGADGFDRTVITPPAASPPLPPRGLKIGRLPGEGCHPAIHAVLDRLCAALAAAGAEIHAVTLPASAAALPAYYLIAPAEASSNLARYDGVRYGLRVNSAGSGAAGLDAMVTASREAGFGAEVKRRILLGAFALSAGYKDAFFEKAQRARGLIAAEFAAHFSRLDFLVGPTTPGPAFKLGEKTGDPVAMYLNDVFTIPSCLAGLPGLNIPAGTMNVEGRDLPLGLQLIGPAGSDHRLLALARTLANGVPAPLAPLH